MIRILKEYTSSTIKRHVLGLLNAAGCRVTNTYNSSQTTKGANASRQFTVHADIVSPGGNQYSLKFDPDPLQAQTRSQYEFVPYNPSIHQGMKLYVRVPVAGYRGDYDASYSVYVKIGQSTSVVFLPKKVTTARDFDKLMTDEFGNNY